MPAFSCSIVFFLILSKSNSSFIQKAVLAKLIFSSLLTQFNSHTLICCLTTKKTDFPENYNILQDISGMLT
ncbi:hypothetical protein F2Y20_00960 [Bacteroides caccae]|uniref:Uncharacterized protein n=1 Tax=Bacteroides caccae TaxID=47678 RepID=A0A9P4AA15_9BACE|nr:hypothetical protein F2Y29_02035 [Bacteroides caccae]KAA2324268.1 hypothetical protein F2Y20_00960 [Bacteroides caccae]KAA2325914.1 hypothetical protein F2Y23_20790 [Bacteroides caccae]KAA2329800.1 hypothetical protein F2Y42_08535 [Bacteroides caccae]KAA2335748.1 hypothetical protein F2Y21_00955 [Bacteroides caccae]